MENLPAGWRKGTTNTEYCSIFKIYKTRDVTVTFSCFNRISAAILDSEYRAVTFLTLSNDVLTVTINDLGGAYSLDRLIAFAHTIDMLIEPELRQLVS